MKLLLVLRRLRPLGACLLAASAVFLTACDSAVSATPSEPGAGTPPPAAAATLPDPVPSPDGKVRLSEAEWRERLTPEQFNILRGSATERPFSCALWKISDKPGLYHCVGCGVALFDSADKFDSGTGWPSFTGPVAPGRVRERADDSHGMNRVEAVCARCEGHLGHVFTDGPAPSGLRYCINGGILRFEPAGAAPAKAQP